MTQPEPPDRVAKGMDETMDLRDHRGRLTRLAIAAAIASVVTIVVLEAIGTATNDDPVGASSVGMLAIAIFVVTTAASLGGVNVVYRRLKK